MTFYLPLPDLMALGVFLLAWFAYRTKSASAARQGFGLVATMNEHRWRWMRQMEKREVRIVDTAIMASLQNGTAFFASTSLIAIGGAATLLRGADDVLRLFADLPFGLAVSRGLWELKSIGLAMIYGYAFFKFSWAYRLYNYAAILIGATPGASSPDAEMRSLAVARAARMSISAGRNFAGGQRAFFFSFAYLGWFIGSYVLFASTVLIVAVIWHRQFRSEALAALLDERAAPETGSR